MIAGFRKSLRSWAMIGVLLFALVAIVVTGFGTGGTGGLGSLAGGGSQAGDTLATVEGKALPASKVNDLVNRQFSIARQQQPTLQMAEFLASGAFDSILNQIVTMEALMAFGRSQGLVVSDEMIDREIANVPQFRNFAGQFDQNVFRSFLANANMTERDLREDLSWQLMQRQLVDPVKGGVRVPGGVVREYTAIQLERRRGTIGVVPAELMTAGIDPTDAEIAAFYRANQRAFTVPERRVIRYALIAADQVRDAAATEAEIAGVYRNNAAAYGPRERRTLQHLVLQDGRQAAAAAQQLRGGAGFAEVASRLGFAAGDLTFADQTRESFARQAPAPVAQAAFAAAQGSVAGPIRSDGAFHIVRVERVATTPGRPLEAVRGEIAAAIERRKRTNALADLVTRIEDQLADGASFAEIVRAERLAVVATPPITAAGRPVGGEPWQAPPELARLLTTAFDIDAEDLEPLVEQLEPNVRFALVGVERVLPAAPPPLAQVRDRVRGALIQRRSVERARAIADQVARRINSGTPPARAFAEAQPRLPAPEEVNMRRLEMSQSGREAPPPLITLFSLPQGRAQVLAAPNNAGWFVVFLAERTAGDANAEPRAIPEMRNALNGYAGLEMALQFARAVELRSRVTRDQEAIRRARQRPGGGAGAE